MSIHADAPHFLSPLKASAVSFVVFLQGWDTGLGFSELTGFTSAVEQQDYSYNGARGHVHTKQFGRPLAPTLTLRRALDARGFSQLMAWHMMARMNNPLCKSVANFTILDASGAAVASCLLEQAWCSKIELDSAKAGASEVVHMKTTIECDSIAMI